MVIDVDVSHKLRFGNHLRETAQPPAEAGKETQMMMTRDEAKAEAMAEASFNAPKTDAQGLDFEAARRALANLNAPNPMTDRERLEAIERLIPHGGGEGWRRRWGVIADALTNAMALLPLLLVLLAPMAHARQASIFGDVGAAPAPLQKWGESTFAPGEASPFALAPILCVTKAGPCQGFAATVNLINVGRFPVELGLLVSQTEPAFLPGSNLPLLTGAGAFLGVGLVEQRGWLLSLFAGGIYADGHWAPVGGLAFHFLAPAAGGT